MASPTKRDAAPPKRESASMAALREGLGRMNVLDGSGGFVSDKPKRRDTKSRDVSRLWSVWQAKLD